MINFLIIFLGFLNPIDLFLRDEEGASVDMASLLEIYQADHNDLKRFHNLVLSDFYLDRLVVFQEDWQSKMDLIDFNSLEKVEKIDFILLKNYIEHELDVIDFKKEENRKTKEAFPFVKGILSLEEERRSLNQVDPKKSAETLMKVEEAIHSKKEEIVNSKENLDPVFANNSSKKINQLKNLLCNNFRNKNYEEMLMQVMQKLYRINLDNILSVKYRNNRIYQD